MAKVTDVGLTITLIDYTGAALHQMYRARTRSVNTESSQVSTNKNSVQDSQSENNSGNKNSAQDSQSSNIDYQESQYFSQNDVAVELLEIGLLLTVLFGFAMVLGFLLSPNLSAKQIDSNSLATNNSHDTTANEANPTAIADSSVQSIISPAILYTMYKGKGQQKDHYSNTNSNTTDVEAGHANTRGLPSSAVRSFGRVANLKRVAQRINAAQPIMKNR